MLNKVLASNTRYNTSMIPVMSCLCHLTIQTGKWEEFYESLHFHILSNRWGRIGIPKRKKINKKNPTTALDDPLRHFVDHKAKRKPMEDIIPFLS